MSVDSIGLAEPLLQAVKALNYKKLTPIQQKAIPLIRKQHDLLASAQTGTGKTAAFLLPILESLMQSPAIRTAHPKAVVLAPTRELAQQVYENAKTLAQYTDLSVAVVYGGAGIASQQQQLAKKVDLVVATPGRLIEHVQQANVQLSHVTQFVLDEADRMLDMGFLKAIEQIISHFKRKPQMLLFSATFSHQIKNLAKQYLTAPITVETAPQNTTSTKVKQLVYRVSELRKRELLSELIGINNWQQVLIFAGTKQSADQLAKELNLDGINTLVCHGDKSQGARNKALNALVEGKVRALVATDVAARGLDIENLPLVVNYHLPFLAEDYVHRVGRTGRAGKSGLAISLVSPKDEKFLANIEKFIGQRFKHVMMPGYEFDPAEEPIIAEKKSIQAKNRHQANIEKNRKIATKQPLKTAKTKKTTRKVISKSKTKGRR